METNYYDGTKLLSLLDINGKKPEIYMCVTNRTAGKTTFFGRMLIRRFLKEGKKFALLYRFNYELDDIPEKFFGELGPRWFPNKEMSMKKVCRGAFVELFLNDIPCGYGVSLNNAEQVKKYSHYFSDVDAILMDEFQSSSNKYCPGEIRKFIIIHTSMARGYGQQSRYLPVYMLSNALSILNPYYGEFNIAVRLRKNTKFLKGTGFVLEQTINESAKEAANQSAFLQAFAGHREVQSANENIYLDDNRAFIAQPSGRSRYICTLLYLGKNYGIREYGQQGFLFCGTTFDKTHKEKIAITTEDHQINYVMLQRNSFLLGVLRDLFQKGCFRFQNLICKEAIIRALSFK